MFLTTGYNAQKDIDTLRSHSKSIWQSTYMDDGMAKCILANSLWTNSNVNYKQDTIDRIADTYYSSVYSGDPVSDDYSKAMKERSEIEAITSILYPDDYSAIGGLNAIEAAGLTVPDDISVVGYDGLYVSQIIHPKLTTYEQNSEEIGRIAAKSLIRLIRDRKSTLIEKILVPGRIIEGGSVKKIV